MYNINIDVISSISLKKGVLNTPIWQDNKTFYINPSVNLLDDLYFRSAKVVIVI